MVQKRSDYICVVNVLTTIHDSISLYVVSCTAAITEGPVSVTALVGTNAQFHCAGTGNYLVWEVDGLAPDHPDILARGITVVTLPSFLGTVHSNLTVPATSVNNGTTVRCAIGVSQFNYTAISNYSTLTVLPGEITCTHSITSLNRAVSFKLSFTDIYSVTNTSRYWSCSQSEVQSIIHYHHVGPSTNCWCTQ